MINNSKALVAYEVFTDEYRCYTFARSPAAARWNMVASAREAGYYMGRFPALLRAKRAPQYDQSLKKNAFRRCYSPDDMY